MPKGRSSLYGVWKACERFGIRPPDVEASWEDCNVEAKSALLGYDQIRTHEEFDEKIAFAGTSRI